MEKSEPGLLKMADRDFFIVVKINKTALKSGLPYFGLLEGGCGFTHWFMKKKYL